MTAGLDAQPERRIAGENFPVALRVLPRARREDLQAVYAFARLVDDLGDEPGDETGAATSRSAPRTAADVEADLAVVRADLDRIYRGQPPAVPALAELPRLVARHAVPRDPFDALVEANLRDQVVHDYATRDELVEYCTFSANPVGELVLRVFDVPITPERRTRSDAVCTALQIVEHLQDVREDARRGRVYLPARDRERHGVTDADLLAPAASAGLRALVAEEAAWALGLLRNGSRLVGDLRGWARVAVAGYVAGGRAALGAVERAGWDPLTAGPPRPRHRDVARVAVQVLRRGGLA